MSINTLSLASDDKQGPSLQPGENVQTPAYLADIELRVPATITGPKRVECAKGRVRVTDRRVIFTADTIPASSSQAYDAPPVLTSLTIPYSHILSCTFHIPTFSPSNMILSFLPDGPSLPSPGRGGKIELKLIVGEGACHSVWKRIEGERARAEERRVDEDTLPLYTAEADTTIEQPPAPPRT
ncbi:MAG: hypothetical protein TREMPRED_002487 [Tremellales sp. Tagirdzhanova-0007]|nr:MAG: hypothetical protein TREMPRED_002487 [Tremellales sp. Tagirdzhanova-0007]